ncbi:Tn3 family transposase [Nonomuraea terrae]|uniref:Tn3 family transposase n=1 Tax=Nonomuraea terrae TaxID=2530383 RepID=UPI0037A16A93
MAACSHASRSPGALGLALNAVIWCNSLYIDADQPSEPGFAAAEGLCARLSPIRYDHISFLGGYAFPRRHHFRTSAVP